MTTILLCIEWCLMVIGWFQWEFQYVFKIILWFREVVWLRQCCFKRWPSYKTFKREKQSYDKHCTGPSCHAWRSLPKVISINDYTKRDFQLSTYIWMLVWQWNSSLFWSLFSLSQYVWFFKPSINTINVTIIKLQMHFKEWIWISSVRLQHPDQARYSRPKRTLNRSEQSFPQNLKILTPMSQF